MRELRNAVRRAALLGGPLLRARDFLDDAPVMAADDRPTHVAIAGRSEAQIMGEVYRKQLALCGGSLRRAARTLGLARSTFADRLRRYAAAGEADVRDEGEGGIE